MPGESLQETQPAVPRARRRLESGQDTTEYILIIILFVLAFTAGMIVWTRNVEGSNNGGADCIALAESRDSGSSGTPLTRGGDQYESRGGSPARRGRRCPPGR